MTGAIRSLQPEDLDAIVALAGASPEAPQWPRSAYAPYCEHDAANPALLRTGVVAVDPGLADAPPVLGFACATLLLDGDRNLAQLDSMAVHPTRRRGGLGATLFREIVAWAARNRARHFSLEVRASNTPALALYRRFGMHVEGRRPRYYADPEEDALLLGMAITAGSPLGPFPP